MNEREAQPLLLHIAWVRWWSALAYHALGLAQGLQRLGRPCGIVAPLSSPLAQRAAELRLEAPRWRPLGSPNPLRLSSAIFALRREVRAGRIVGVIVHTGRGHLPAALALRGGTAPLLRVRADIRRPSRGFLQRWLYARATDRVLISGEFMRRDYFEGLGIAAERLAHLPAGFDAGSAARIDREASRARIRRERGWPPETRVVGMLARYSPVKGHRDLVDAAARIAALYPDVRFVTAGPEGQVGRERVAGWVRDAGLAERFAVLGPVEDALPLAAGLDVAVIASRGSEAVCRSALEYMGLGVPLVASAIHVIPETVGECAVLVPPGEPEALAAGIASLLEDPARAAQLGRCARERVEIDFAPSTIAERAARILDAARAERVGVV
ncbi:MAG: glycosyltransferase family 4 protein [Verrucomicrobia bacterium]|nr:glycosyltransferase family 4 protein [Verrucomicrobiota bacterium]